MSTDHRGNPLLTLGGAINHAERIERERATRTRLKVDRELREMGGGASLMDGGAPPSKVRNYDKDYEGKRQGPSY